MRTLKLLGVTLALFSAQTSYSAIEASKLREARSLMTAYKSATKIVEALPISSDASECLGKDCAFNYETDREDFGINARFRKLPGKKKRVVVGFRVDPNGTSLDQDSSFEIPSLPFGIKLDAIKLAQLAETIQSSFKSVTGVYGDFKPELSQCQVGTMTMHCDLAYGSQTISLEAMIDGTAESLYSIETLNVKTPGL